MTKLTQAQTEFLTATKGKEASAPPSGSHKTITALIKRGLIVASVNADGPAQYAITDAGCEALAANTTVADIPPPEPQPATASPPKPTGKIATLVELLGQADGTTIGAMMDATGWQAHSVRGALSGAIKKGLGLEVVSEKTEDGRRYRIPADAQ